MCQIGKFPSINFNNEGGISRFDGQLIIQLENHPIEREAANRLVKKHPQISVLVQLDRQENILLYMAISNICGSK
ncbi:MAG: C80 family cysteine peptidase [Candidatus Phlomobacter fragariae]